MTRYLAMRTAYLSATLATILASHCAMSATAESQYEVTRRVVNFADLDITRAAGAAALYARIDTAAQEVCEPQFRSFRLQLSAQMRRCWEEAVERAVTDVNAPALTSYHLTKMKPSGNRK